MKSVGLVNMRQRSCWCLKCMQAMMTGSLDWQPSKSMAEFQGGATFDQTEVMSMSMTHLPTYKQVRDSGLGMNANVWALAQEDKDMALSRLSLV